jgi:uncharacterized OsmC-like protein
METPTLAGEPIESLAQMASILRRRPELALVRLAAETRKLSRGSESSRVLPNPVIQGRGGTLIAEDLLLVLARCIAYDFTALAQHEGVPLEALTARVTGELDLRSAAGDEKAPAGFLAIDVTLLVTGPAARVELERVLRMTTATSVVVQSLRAVPLRIHIAPVANAVPPKVTT